MLEHRQLNIELKIRSKKYLVQSRSFAEMLEATIRKQQNRPRRRTSTLFQLVRLPTLLDDE